jgi:hypothetical protein
VQEFPVKLGKRLPIAQMMADLLITDMVRRQQKSLNYFETVLTRVIETAGFPERYTTNAKPSGVWLPNRRRTGRRRTCRRWARRPGTSIRPRARSARW